MPPLRQLRSRRRLRPGDRRLLGPFRPGFRAPSNPAAPKRPARQIAERSHSGVRFKGGTRLFGRAAVRPLYKSINGLKNRLHLMWKRSMIPANHLETVLFLRFLHRSRMAAPRGTA